MQLSHRPVWKERARRMTLPIDSSADRDESNLNVVSASASASARDTALDSESTPPGQASVLSTALNLSNNIVGAGMLSLPWCMKEASLLPGVFFLLCTGLMSCVSFIMIAHCCEELGCFNYKDLARKAVSERFSQVVQFVMVFYTAISCLSLLILTCDFIAGNGGIAIEWCGKTGSECGIAHYLTHRPSVVLFTMLFVLAPLVSLNNLNALRFSSVLSCVSMLYMCFMLIDQYYQSHHINPCTGEKPIVHGFAISPGVFTANPIINVAFIAHYNAPNYYKELKQRNLKTFRTAVGLSFSMVSLIYCIVAIFGYATFGNATQSDVLENFRASVGVAIVGRVAMTSIVLFTYPLAFFSLRNLCLKISCLHAREHSRRTYWGTTALLLVLTTLPATVLTDIGVVLAYKGALFGAMIAFGFPAVLFLNVFHPGQFSRRRQQFYTPVDSDGENDDGDVETNRDGSLSLGASTGRRSKGRLYCASMCFMGWTMVMVVLGTLVTTLKLLQVIESEHIPCVYLADE